MRSALNYAVLCGDTFFSIQVRNDSMCLQTDFVPVRVSSVCVCKRWNETKL